MLHELLLLLSAHDSSVFKPWPPSPASPETVVLDSTFTNVHPSERAALNALAHLAFLHKTLRDSTSRLISSHSSIVVRAVLSAVRDKAHGFEDTVEKIERMILARDDSVVGAYDIVPLARLTTLLGEWDRIIEYMCGFVLETTNESTGAQVLDRLHRHENTGYPDIAEVVAKLIAAGEEAWLRQVSSWVLYGCIPQLGHSDFFIHPSDDPNISPLDENAFIIDWSLWPAHLPRETGSSIFFVGRALARIQTQSSLRQLATQEILKCHLDYLNSLDFPLAPNVFTRAITSIRLSLSSSILSNLLPLDTIIRLVKRFRQDFLLGHGSLMITLLSVTDEYRVRRTERDGGTIKEAEVNNLLTKAWSIISRVESVRDEEDDPERQAYERSLKLSLKSTEKPADGTGLIMFDEFLLGQRVQLKYEISWPLDLFLSKTDIAEYDRIFNFLLAVKRSQGRLTSLWPGRKYSHVRRVTWATIKYALFFIDSLWNYFQATVIEPSFSGLLANLLSDNDKELMGYDPEALRSSHTSFLADLLDGLFLSSDSVNLSRLLKQLLQHIDAAVEIIQQDEDIDAVRANAIRAVVDECVHELEIVGELDGKGRVEKLLLGLDGGQWFTDNLIHDGAK